MRIVSRYFAARFIGFFAGILFASTLMIITVEMLLNLDDMLRQDSGVSGIPQYLFLRIPSYYLRELIPIAAFAAAFFTLGFSARWLEVVAMKAGGISPYGVLAPILLTATLLALMNFVLIETWITNATREWNAQRSGIGSAIRYDHGSFWYHRGRTIYNISSSNPSQGTLRGVRIYELDPKGRLIRSIDGDTVHVEDDDRWRFENAVIRSYDPQSPDASIEVRQAGRIEIVVAKGGESPLVDMDLRGLNIRQLHDYVEVRRAAGADVHRLQTALYTRLSESFSVILFVVLAAPLGFHVEVRRGFGMPAVAGIVILAAYFALRSVVTTLASEGVVPAVLAMSALIGVFGLAGVWRVIAIRG